MRSCFLLPVALFFFIWFVVFPGWGAEAVMSLFVYGVLVIAYLLRSEEEGGK